VVSGSRIRTVSRNSFRTVEETLAVDRCSLCGDVGDRKPPPGRQSLIYAEILKKIDEIAADRWKQNFSRQVCQLEREL